MWTWLVVIGLVVAFCCWMAWVLHKRTPPQPGQHDHEREHRYYYGQGGS
jgi:hypothetical protein